MTIPQTQAWRWSIRIAAVLAIATLWRTTASDDVEGLLWRHYSTSVAGFNAASSLAIVTAAYVLRSRTAVMHRLAAAALSISVTALGVGLLEVPAALFGHDYRRTFGTGQVTDNRPQRWSTFNRRDPDLLYIHKPHTRFVGNVSGNLMEYGIPPSRYAVDVQYDQNGFRNSVDLARAEVVAIGDSFVEGAEVAERNTAVAHLARRLGVTVGNLGQVGYGPQQELVVLERYGVPLAPKVVVWFLFGGNDLHDAETYERARRDSDAPVETAPWSVRSFTRNALIAVANLTTPTRRTPAPAARHRAAEFTTAEGEKEVVYFDNPEGPWTSRQLEMTTNTLQRARDLTTRSGANLLVVYVPRKFRVYGGYIHPQADSLLDRWASNDLPAVLGQWCAERSIDFLDLTPALRQSVSQGEAVYLPDDVHWNANGHAVVAAAVADYIRPKGWLSATQPPGMSW